MLLWWRSLALLYVRLCLRCRMLLRSGLRLLLHSRALGPTAELLLLGLRLCLRLWLSRSPALPPATAEVFLPLLL